MQKPTEPESRWSAAGQKPLSQLNQGRRALVATGLSANSAQKQIEVRDGLRPEDATKAAYDALACRYGNGPITGRIRAITATG